MAFNFFTAKEFTPISPMCPAPPHHTLARHDPYTQTPRNEFRTVRPGRRRASEVMGTAGWRPQQLSRRARRTRSGPAGRPDTYIHTYI